MMMMMMMITMFRVVICQLLNPTDTHVMAAAFLSHSRRWLRVKRRSMFAGELPRDVTAGYHDYDGAGGGDVTAADYGGIAAHYPADYYYVDYGRAPPPLNGSSHRCFPDDVTPAAGIPCNGTWPGDAATWSGGTGSSNWWALILIVFPVLTVFGNVLVVVSVYREKTLQSVTNCLLTFSYSLSSSQEIGCEMTASPKRPVSCRVGCETLTESVDLLSTTTASRQSSS